MASTLIFVVGASAGGVETLKRLFKDFPHTSQAAFFVTLHVSPQAHSVMDKILREASGLPASSPQQRQPIEPGHIYIAPPNLHLLVGRETVEAVHGPRENRQRPAINHMFRSAAIAHGRKVIGMVLTGALDDGAMGLLEIKKHGGLTMVQAPDDAIYPEMPEAAIEVSHPHLCIPLNDIRKIMQELCTARAPGKLLAELKRRKCRVTPHSKKHSMADHTLWTERRRHLGRSSELICPECYGPLFEDSKTGQLSCVVGHAFSLRGLLSAQAEELEKALWIAMRTLEERAALQVKIGREVSGANPRLKKIFTDRAKESDHHAQMIRKIIDRHQG